PSLHPLSLHDALPISAQHSISKRFPIHYTRQCFIKPQAHIIVIKKCGRYRFNNLTKRFSWRERMMISGWFLQFYSRSTSYIKKPVTWLPHEPHSYPQDNKGALPQTAMTVCYTFVS